MPYVEPATTLVEEQLGEAGSKGAFGQPGERAIEVPAVRQIPAEIEKARDIDNRHGNERTAKLLECAQLDDATDDLYAVELIAVQGRRHEQLRTIAAAVDDVNRHGERNVGRELDKGQVDLSSRTRANFRPADADDLR